MRTRPHSRTATIVLFGALAVSVGREVRADNIGDASDALPGIGRVIAVGPMGSGLGVALSGGYGYTGSVLRGDDVHHRALGILAASYRLDHFAFGLKLTGRYDHHLRVETGSDDGFVGDPEIYAVAATDVAKGLWLGARASLWMPGGETPPSIAFGAVSPTLDLLVRYTPRRSKLTLAANAGFRLDRSSEAIENADTLSRADRMALGVSDFNAVPLGVGLSYRVGSFEALVEWTWGLLVGSGAPGALFSPMAVGFGGRYSPEGSALQLEMLANVAVNDRPLVAATGPLIPIEPRVGVQLGVRYGFFGGADEPIPPPPPPPSKPEPPPPPPVGIIEGAITSPGGNPIEGAIVRTGTISTSSDEAGRFVLRGVSSGRTSVEISVPGYKVNESIAEVTPGQAIQLSVVLEPELPDGEIRGTIRSFRGSGIPATLRLLPLDKEVQANPDGTFRIVVPPGSYDVTIEAPRYRTQKRSVVVETNGVTVLNVDLVRSR